LAGLLLRLRDGFDLVEAVVPIACLAEVTSTVTPCADHSDRERTLDVLFDHHVLELRLHVHGHPNGRARISNLSLYLRDRFIPQYNRLDSLRFEEDVG